MTTTKKRMIGKCLALCLILITLGSIVFSLTSCAGDVGTSAWKASEYKWDIELTVKDEDGNPIKDADGKEIKETISVSNYNFVANVIASNDDLKKQFLAASRGYASVDANPENYVYDRNITVKDPTIRKWVAYVTDSEWNTKRSDVSLASAVDVLQKIVDNDTAFHFDNNSDREVLNGLLENWKTRLEAYNAAVKSETLTDSIVSNYEEAKDEVWAIAQLPAMHYGVNIQSSPGFFEYILYGFGWVMGGIAKLLGGQYLLALLVFAILIEAAMLPLAIKQQKNTVGMAKLRPMIAKIEKKYAGRYDRATQQKKQQEIMELQQKSGFSPMSGCLPLIIQLIIVGFILYPIITSPLQYMLNTNADFGNALTVYATSPVSLGGLGLNLRNGNVMEVLSHLNAENIGGITEFELLDIGSRFACLDNYTNINVGVFNFSLFGQNGGINPYFWSWLLVVPVLNLLAQFGSMWISKKIGGQPTPAMATGSEDQSKGGFQMMNLIAPLLTLIVMFNVPAMIGVYWLIRTVISTVTRIAVAKAMPAPKFTEDEIKEIEKAEREARKAQKEMLNTPHRSLHYIDEDDYDELPETPQNESNQKKPDISGDDAPEIKD